MTTIRRRLADFVPARLTQARRVAGWTMVELADRVMPRLTRQAISSFERGSSTPSAETLRALASALSVDPAFFMTPLRTRELESAVESAMTFRTLSSSTKRSKGQTEVFLHWLAGLGEHVEELIELPAVMLPDFGISDFAALSDDQIEEIATKTRRAFGLGDGPISDLTLLLENKGVLVAFVQLAPGTDGISAWIGGKPVVLISDKAYAARARFDLAHELAHLILHRSLTTEDLESKEMLRLVEHQAHHFGSCFLMPEATFAREMFGVDEQSLIAAKRRWGVSMQAIIMRLNSIGLISDSQKIRAFQALSAKGQRKKEPLDGVTPPERPRLLKKAAEFARDNNVIELAEFFDGAKYPAHFVASATGLEIAKVPPPSNVLLFKLKAAG